MRSNLTRGLAIAVALAALAVFAMSGSAPSTTTTDPPVAQTAAAGPTSIPATSIPATSSPATTAPSSIIEPEDVEPVRVVAVGDIAVCGSDEDGKVAALVESLDPEYILAAGDLAYPEGSAENYRDCWEPIWGELEDRVRPTPGNHDYRTAGAEPYFERFGQWAPSTDEAWYRFEVGAWTILSVDSNCRQGDRCDEGSDQMRWIDEQLTGLESSCVLVFTHHPRFSSGHHGNVDGLADLWGRFDEGDVEIVVTGHEHSYERLGPMAAASGEPSEDGLIQFVAGTGGASLRQFPGQLETSRRRIVEHGALELTLSEHAFQWTFHDVDGGTPDSGSHQC